MESKILERLSLDMHRQEIIKKTHHKVMRSQLVATTSKNEELRALAAYNLNSKPIERNSKRPYIEVFGVKTYINSAEDRRMAIEAGFEIKF